MVEFRIHFESARCDSGYTLCMLRAVVSSERPRRADGPAAFRRWFGARLRGAIDPAVVSALADAIQAQEGYYPGSLSYRNNNPGNLVYVGQANAVPGLGGFAKYNSYQDGRAGLEAQITLDAVRGTDVNGSPTTTVSELLTSWAPPSENNTAAYIANVSAATGFDPDAPLSTLVGSRNYSFGGNAGGSDFSSELAAPVDLSGIGISSPVPLYWLIAGGLFFVALARD
jgi:hypothetical protein